MFANSSHIVSTGRCTESVIRGYAENDSLQPRIAWTDSHSYANRCHVLCAFTDGEFKIPDTLLSAKKRLNAQEETLELSGTQRHLGGLLCTNKLQRKLHVLWFTQAKLPVSLLRQHIPRMVLYVYGQEPAS